MPYFVESLLNVKEDAGTYFLSFHNIILVKDAFQLLTLFADTLTYSDNKSFVLIMFYITCDTFLSFKLPLTV
jgi:hypothetical protein